MAETILELLALAILACAAPYALGLVRRVYGLKPIGWNREGAR